MEAAASRLFNSCMVPGLRAFYYRVLIVTRVAAGKSKKVVRGIPGVLFAQQASCLGLMRAGDWRFGVMALGSLGNQLQGIPEETSQIPGKMRGFL